MNDERRQAMVTGLIEKGYLADGEADDPALVEDALLRLVDDEARERINAFMADPKGAAKVRAYRRRDAYRQKKLLRRIFGQQ